MKTKEELKEKLLKMDDLKEVNGGNYTESFEISDAIDANPYLADMWYEALNQAYEWEPDDDLFFFLAAQQVLRKIGIGSTFYDGSGIGFGNEYYAGNNENVRLSHQQVLEIIRNYKG